MTHRSSLPRYTSQICRTLASRVLNRCEMLQQRENRAQAVLDLVVDLLRWTWSEARDKLGNQLFESPWLIDVGSDAPSMRQGKVCGSISHNSSKDLHADAQFRMVVLIRIESIQLAVCG
mgnify:CR=1 FL=1